MKKQLLHATLGALLFFPLYGYAAEEVSSSTLIKKDAIPKELSVDEATSTASTTVKSFTVCSQEAIENRDTKIATSRAQYNTSMASALTERKNKEKAAVAVLNADDKKDAIKLSIETYRNQAKGAQTILTQARKATWQTFEDDIALCRDIEKSIEVLDNEPSGSAARSVEPTLKKTDETESKSIKETIKAGIESLRSLFN